MPVYLMRRPILRNAVAVFFFLLSSGEAHSNHLIILGFGESKQKVGTSSLSSQ